MPDAPHNLILKVSIDDLAVVCTRTISRARADAMKLRMAIMQVASNETEYRRSVNHLEMFR